MADACPLMHWPVLVAVVLSFILNAVVMIDHDIATFFHSSNAKLPAQSDSSIFRNEGNRDFTRKWATWLRPQSCFIVRDVQASWRGCILQYVSGIENVTRFCPMEYIRIYERIAATFHGASGDGPRSILG